MRLSELIMWYLEQVESEIDDIDYATLVVRKIIKRLLKTVSVLIFNLYFTYCVPDAKFLE